MHLVFSYYLEQENFRTDFVRRLINLLGFLTVKIRFLYKLTLQTFVDFQHLVWHKTKMTRASKTSVL